MICWSTSAYIILDSLCERCLLRDTDIPKGGNSHLSIVSSPPSLQATAMASLIAILDLKGKPLIQRSYRDDVPPSYVERFLPLVLDIEEEGQQVTPCFSSQGINYMHIRHSNLYREHYILPQTVRCSTDCPRALKPIAHVKSSPSRNKIATQPRSSPFYTDLLRYSLNTSKNSRKNQYEITLLSYMNLWTR